MKRLLNYIMQKKNQKPLKTMITVKYCFILDDLKKIKKFREGKKSDALKRK